MNLIRKSTWMALILGAVVGCAGEEEAAKPSNPVTPPPSESPSTATKGEPAKATPSSEMTPPPAKAKDDAKPSKPEGAPKLEGPNQTSNSGASPTKLTAEELAAIKELPAAEQAVAIKQAVCPVSNHHLGSMEKPIKVSAEGRSFYLCCEECEKEVKTNPKGVIAKLDQAAKKSD